MQPIKELISCIRNCTKCAAHLTAGPRPILAASESSKIVIIGQAPGSIVHRTGIPWDDKSGENLRAWMGVTSQEFYDPEKIAIVPMGFCYPGKGKSGDLPPRKECAPLWHEQLIEKLENVELILLIGKYAQDYYLDKKPKFTLTERVKNFENYLPQYFVLPHPSPRNNIWKTKNKWFDTLVLPKLKARVKDILF